jgi:hypothetical protein
MISPTSRRPGASAESVTVTDLVDTVAAPADEYVREP